MNDTVSETSHRRGRWTLLTRVLQMRCDGLVLGLVEGPAHRLLPSGLTSICYVGPVSGRTIRFPAQSVTDGGRFSVVAGRPERKPTRPRTPDTSHEAGSR